MSESGVKLLDVILDKLSCFCAIPAQEHNHLRPAALLAGGCITGCTKEQSASGLSYAIGQISFLCDVLIEGADDGDLEYIIRRVQGMKTELDVTLETVRQDLRNNPGLNSRRSVNRYNEYSLEYHLDGWFEAYQRQISCTLGALQRRRSNSETGIFQQELFDEQNREEGTK